MAVIDKKHQSSQVVSRLVADIVFNAEFTNLWEELAMIYKEADLHNPQQEAFCDAFYTIYTEGKSGSRALYSPGIKRG